MGDGRPRIQTRFFHVDPWPFVFVRGLRSSGFWWAGRCDTTQPPGSEPVELLLQWIVGHCGSIMLYQNIKDAEHTMILYDQKMWTALNPSIKLFKIIVYYGRFLRDSKTASIQMPTQLCISNLRSHPDISSYVSSFPLMLYIIMLHSHTVLMVASHQQSHEITIESHTKSQFSQRTIFFSTGWQHLARAMPGASLWRLQRQLGISAMGLYWGRRWQGLLGPSNGSGWLWVLSDIFC